LSAQIIDGTAVAARLLEQVTHGTAEFTRENGRQPCLAAVLVGDDPASHTYVRMKRSRSAKVGMESRYVELPAATTTPELASRRDHRTIAGPGGGRNPAAAPGARAHR
jgi:methylenetetrahydrofolate dehydrogenase (NADP+)/methenyltetrahydrofolate cyclohydrolase